jgi:hypothetical protein
MSAAESLAALLAVYAVSGAVFAPAFAWRGAAQLDPAARDSGLGFRLILLPGAAALWPLLLAKWVRSRRTPAA